MSIKKIFCTLVGLATMLAPFVASPVHAASYDTLIKGQDGTTVYWYASNGERYVFPNTQTFYSWFSSNDFNNVNVLSDTELETIPLGGNVVYRPGAKLVKVTTDPRVYAVSRYGVLRWVTSENVAENLYGPSWAQWVEDIPDTFFTNYTVGNPIYSASDYNVGNEYNATPNPTYNILTTAGSPISTPYYPVTTSGNTLPGILSLSIGNQAPGPFDNQTISASLTSSQTPAQDIVISLYQDNAIIQTCTASNFCSASFNLNGSSTNQHTYYARATDNNGEYTNSTYTTITTYGSVATNSIPSVIGTALEVRLSKNQVNIGDTFNIYADILPANDYVMPYNITIYDQWGTVIQTCSSANSCTGSVTMNNTGDTQRQYYARAVSYNSSNTLNSNYITVSITQNQTNSYEQSNAQISITSSLGSGTPGEALTLNATLGYQTIVSQSSFIEIRNQNDGSLLQRCYDTSYCSVSTVLPSNVQSIRYYAVLTDNTGALYAANYTPYITIQLPTYTIPTTNNVYVPPTSYTPFSGDVTLNVTPSAQIYSGESATLAAAVTNYNVSESSLSINIYSSSGQIVQTCNGVDTCSVTLTYNTVSGSDYRYYAIASSNNSQQLPPVYSPDITVSPVVASSSDTTNANTFAGTLSISPSSVTVGEYYSVGAQLNDPTQAANTIIQIYSSNNPTPVQTCTGMSSCLYKGISVSSSATSFYAHFVSVSNSGLYAISNYVTLSSS